MDTVEGDDHYEILGLPSGEEGAKLTPGDIKKAYRAKALSSHPDKRPDDPHAHSTFQKITSSYKILKNPEARKAFDALLRARNDRLLRRVFHLDPNRRRMMSDLEERERAAFAVDPKEKDRTEEERAARKFQEEVTRIREMHAKKKTAVEGEGSGTREGLEKARLLKVSWERDGEDYSAERLKKLFTRFGKVEDVVIRDKGSKKKRSALVVMATKEVAVAATQSMRGDISNPLDVVPLHPDDNHSSSTPPMKHAKSDAPNLSNLVGAGYQAYEDSILKKLQKVVWNIQLRRNLDDWEIDEFVQLLDCIQQANPNQTNWDNLIWRSDRSSIFSVSSFYKQLIFKPGNAATYEPHFIWKYPVPPNLQVFENRKILTVVNLRRKEMILTNVCICCLKAEETVEHLLIHCPFVSSIWADLLFCFKISWCFPKDADLLLKAWHGIRIGKLKTRLWRMAILAAWWVVWTERNSRCFRNESKSPQLVASFAK